MDFSERLKDLRKAARMTQQQLADASDTPIGTIQGYEQGRREPSVEVASRMAAALGVQLDQLWTPAGAEVIVTSIPLLGVVACGEGSEEELTGEALKITGEWAGCVAYIASGDSMKDANILEGDYLIVRPNSSPTPPCIVVAWKHGIGAVAKRFDGKYLRSCNEKERKAYLFNPEEGDEIKGVLVWVLRKT